MNDGDKYWEKLNQTIENINDWYSMTKNVGNSTVFMNLQFAKKNFYIPNLYPKVFISQKKKEFLHLEFISESIYI